MNERLQYSTDEQGLSRREFFRRARNSFFGAAVLATGYRLTEGVSLNEPPLDLRTVSFGRHIENTQLSFGEISEKSEERVMTITPEGKLLFEPSGEFFAPGREFSYIHRANSIEFIHKAHDMGANLFDIDANDVNGTVYAEHGIIPQLELRLGKRDINLKIPIVFDRGEEELKLGMPKYTYEELVACVASLSTPEHPLAVSTELKRGEFELLTLNEMLNAHQRYDVPVIMHPTDPLQLEMLGKEIASS